MNCYTIRANRAERDDPRSWMEYLNELYTRRNHAFQKSLSETSRIIHFYFGCSYMSSTLSEVAKRARVSVATASRVLSNSSYGVAEELRERVLVAAEELNYVPNAHAQALANNRTSTVGVIVGDVSDPYFSEIVRGIQRVAEEAGRLVTICNSYRDPERELAYVKLLHAQRVEALILAGGGLDDLNYSRKMVAEMMSYSSSGGRISLIGRHQLVGNSVVPDNFGGARDLGREIVALGHRDIGIVSGPELVTTTRDRLSGFLDALEEAGISVPTERIVGGDFSRGSGVRASHQLLKHNPNITAMFALNDQMAVGALVSLRERGVRVPRDVSVVGFDDIPIAHDVTPALSTVRLELAEMGARATEFAIGEKGEELKVSHFPATVILRGSTASASPL